MLYNGRTNSPDLYFFAYVFLSGNQVQARIRRMEDFLKGARFEKLVDGFTESGKKVSGWRGKIDFVIAFAEKMEKAGNGKDFTYYVHLKMNGNETPRVMDKLTLFKLKKYRDELKKPAQ